MRVFAYLRLCVLVWGGGPEGMATWQSVTYRHEQILDRVRGVAGDKASQPQDLDGLQRPEHLEKLRVFKLARLRVATEKLDPAKVTCSVGISFRRRLRTWLEEALLPGSHSPAKRNGSNEVQVKPASFDVVLRAGGRT